MLQLSHRPPAVRKASLLTAYDLAKVGFFLFGIPKNAFGAIDVSKECNLRCRHCYFFEQDYDAELGVGEWIGELEGVKRDPSVSEFPFLHFTRGGGHPLSRT